MYKKMGKSKKRAFPFFNDKNKLKTLEILFLFLSLRSRKNI